jgi:hypothetical protein
LRRSFLQLAIIEIEGKKSPSFGWGFLFNS